MKMADTWAKAKTREKITLNDLIKKYPDGVTVNGFDYYGPYPVLFFAEDKNKFFHASSGDLKKITDAMLEDYEGDLGAINEDLAAFSPKVRIRKVKTTANNDYVKVEDIS